MRNPLHDVAIIGAYNTRQAKVLEGASSRTVTLDAARGALADAGLTLQDVDGVSVSSGMGAEFGSADFVYETGMEPAWTGSAMTGIPAVLEAAAAIAAGLCHTVLIASGQAGIYTERASTAPWTRPSSEFVECWGLFTAAEFALIARRHMHLYGTTPYQMAAVAAIIRNNGSRNPEAVHYGRGPYTPQDILNSRMIADPLHLLDCAMTSEGGSAVVLTTAERARAAKARPVSILSGGLESCGPAYRHPPSWDVTGRVGRKAARRAFEMAGIGPEDVDVCELYDPFSFEVIRQLEAFGFCGEGEGGAYVTSGVIEPSGRHPVCTDGGLLAHSHTGTSQLLQKVVQASRQLRGDAVNQVQGARVALCSNGGAGALFTHVLILGRDRP